MEPDLTREPARPQTWKAPPSAATPSSDFQTHYEAMHTLFAQRDFDPRTAIPHIVAIVRLARCSTDDSNSETLIRAFFDSSLPASLRYVIPALLLPMPDGEAALKMMTLHEREAEAVPVLGLLTAITHLDGQARTLWESDTFWTGYFIANSDDFGVHFCDRWSKEHSPAASPMQSLSSGGATLQIGVGSGPPVDTLGYDQTINWTPPDSALTWLSEGFLDEERPDVVGKLMFLMSAARKKQSIVDFVINYYLHAGAADLKFGALKPLMDVDTEPAGRVFRNILENPPDARSALIAVMSTWALTSHDPTLVAPVIRCYSQYKDDESLDINPVLIARSLARKESPAAFDYLDRLFETSPGEVLDGMPDDVPASVVSRAREILDRGASSPDVGVRRKAYEAVIRAFPNECQAVLQRVAVTEPNDSLRLWATEQLKIR